MIFLQRLKSYLWIGLILGLVSLGSFSYIQSKRLAVFQQEARDLKQQIIDLEEAVALTESLRADNAKLTAHLDDLTRELGNAKGYSDPLSDDIRRIIDRMRSTP